MSGRITVVGLGPAGGDLVVPAARIALESVESAFVRTARHPAVAELEAAGLRFRPLDHHYRRASSIDAVYDAIVAELLDAAEREDRVVYAVPGSPAVAERTVDLLRSSHPRVDVLPGVSFLELVWARLRLDPADGATVVDARSGPAALADRGGPFVVTQCDTPAVLSDVKLALLEVMDGDDEVVVLARLGSPDESITTVRLAELDRAVEPDERTALCADPGTRLGAELGEFVALMERLRGPGGCPWDAEQTHHTLARYAIEEAYEVVEAIEALPPAAPRGEVEPGSYDALADELGDLLCQVVFHATLAKEAGAFTMEDVIGGIHEKLVRRHPHVFGDDEADDAGTVARNWERIKREERGATPAFAEIPVDLPSLAYTTKLLSKAKALGLAAPVPSLDEAVAALGSADEEAAGRALGALLAAAVADGRARGVDAETALRGWAAELRSRLEAAAP